MPSAQSHVFTACVCMVLFNACASTQPVDESVRAGATLRAQSPAEKSFIRAKEAADRGEWKTASRLFAEAARLDAHMDAAKINGAIALERAGYMRRAEQAYQRILRKNPKNPDAAASVARTLLLAQERNAAMRVLATALKHNPEHPGLLLMQADVMLKRKSFDKAQALVHKVLLRDQKNVAAIKTLALLYMNKGKLQLAEMLFRSALKLHPQDAGILVNLGLLADKRGDPQRAVLEFDAALKLDPHHGVALANTGALALRFRDYVRAARSYTAAIKYGVRGCAAQSALGYALQGQQQAKPALAQLEKAYSVCRQGEGQPLLMAMGSICMDQLRNNACALRKFQAFVGASKSLKKDHPVFRFIRVIKEQMAMEEELAPPKHPQAVLKATPVLGG